VASIQEEDWKLHQDLSTPTLYRGNYFLRQTPELPPNQIKTSAHAPVHMTFECEIYLTFHPALVVNNNNNNNNKTKNSHNYHNCDYKNELKHHKHNSTEKENKGIIDDEKEEKEEVNVKQIDRLITKHNNTIECTNNKIKEKSLVTEFDGLELE